MWHGCALWPAWESEKAPHGAAWCGAHCTAALPHIWHVQGGCRGKTAAGVHQSWHGPQMDTGHDLLSSCHTPALTAVSLYFAVQRNMAAAEEVIEKAREDGTLEQQRAAFEAEVEQAEQEDRAPWEAPTEAQQAARARRREVRDLGVRGWVHNGSMMCRAWAPTTGPATRQTVCKAAGHQPQQPVAAALQMRGLPSFVTSAGASVAGPVRAVTAAHAASTVAAVDTGPSSTP